MVPKIRLIRVIIEHLVFISSRGLLITEMICTKIQTKKREKKHFNIAVKHILLFNFRHTVFYFKNMLFVLSVWPSLQN